MIKKDFNYYAGKKYDSMMGRCYRETDASYKYYGAVNIKVCLAWIKSIESFRCWVKAELQKLKISEVFFMKNTKNLVLDRINPLGHYEPTNCRIVNTQTNSRNKIKNKGKMVESCEGVKVIFGDCD